MSQVSKHFMNPKIASKVYEVFINSIKNSRSKNEVITFLDDLLSPSEKTMLAKRVAIAYMLLENKYTYQEISKTLKISFGTIAKVHATFALKGDGYRKIIGNLVTNKIIKNFLSEFLDIVTPNKKSLTGEIYLKPKYKSKMRREEPL
jgi:uncharacterized protein YerC